MKDYKKVVKLDRKKLDRITYDLVGLISARNRIAMEIGDAKRHLGIRVVDRKREAVVLAEAGRLARRMKVDRRLVARILRLLIKSGRKAQKAA